MNKNHNFIIWNKVIKLHSKQNYLLAGILDLADLRRFREERRRFIVIKKDFRES